MIHLVRVEASNHLGEISAACSVFPNACLQILKILWVLWLRAFYNTYPKDNILAKNNAFWDCFRWIHHRSTSKLLTPHSLQRFIDGLLIYALPMLWTGFASASRELWVRPCDRCFGRTDLIEQDTNTPVDKASNWYVLIQTKRGKLLPFMIMIYKLRLWMISSKVSSLCTQYSDRKYSFSSSATSWFRIPNFQHSKATDEDAGEVTASQCFDRTNLV